MAEPWILRIGGTSRVVGACAATGVTLSTSSASRRTNPHRLQGAVMPLAYAPGRRLSKGGPKGWAEGRAEASTLPLARTKVSMIH